jgi:GntR family transcriptional regulator
MAGGGYFRTMGGMALSEGPLPPWRQILAIYVGKIESGELASGARLPSIKGLSQEYGVAMSTAQKVIEELKRQGLAVTSVMGTFVK